MAKCEILYNEKLGNYTLKKEVDGVLSTKKVPLNYKQKDTTSQYRKEQLKEKILKNS